MMWFPDAASAAFGLFPMQRGAFADPPGTEAAIAADQDDLRIQAAAGWFFCTLTKPSSLSGRHDLIVSPRVV
ncbi:MAG: hypothetical protein INF92_17635 [Rhodobacter sp.]|jgi:hypothetical protein|nr:hypothetical protein [Rhodobacter sp.]